MHWRGQSQLLRTHNGPLSQPNFTWIGKKTGNSSMWLSKYGRGWMEKPVAYVVNGLHRLGITPNAVTYTGFLLTIITAVVLATGSFVWGAVLLLVASLLDLIDGSLARATAQSSTFGAFLDSTLDRYSESVTFLALAWYYSGIAGSQWHLMLIFLTVVGSLMVSYTRARAEALSIECKEGWMQRPERIALLILGLFTGWILPVLALMAVLTNFTAGQRIYQVYWKIQQSEQARNAAVLAAPKDKQPA
jgi:CDP-diacylglycerol--glycerol-3-phosphate 3-phosphatidyltransferase